MSNFIYGRAKESLLKGEISVTTNAIRLLLIDGNQYIPSQNSDQFVSDVPVGAVRDRSGNLQNITTTLGVFDADDITLTEYNGQSFTAVIGYQQGSNDASSRLIFYVDTATGLPFTGSSSTSPVTIFWDNGINKIISL
jgi:hypothetical protein